LHSASSQPHSRPSTPGSVHDRDLIEVDRTSIDHMTFGKSLFNANGERSAQDHEKQAANKHTLLASAANQNYQRCYRALKSHETYWAGVKYILTVLDQKAKGVGDPLLYTREEMESALELPRPEPSFTSPGWRRKLSWGTYLTAQTPDVDLAKVPAVVRNNRARTPIPGSPMVHPSQGTFNDRICVASAYSHTAIGWSLTGTMNSPSTNVAVMYTSDNNPSREIKPPVSGTQPSIASVLSNPPIKFENNAFSSPSSFPPQAPLHTFDPVNMPPPPSAAFNTIPTPDPVLVSDADLLLNLHSPFSTSSPNTTNSRLPNPSFAQSQHRPSNPPPNHNEFSPNAFPYPSPSDHVFGDMVIDSQDVDMSVLGADMMPWDLEYLPHDIMFYGDGGFGVGGDEDGGVQEG
jgi:hypothetical protein